MGDDPALLVSYMFTWENWHKARHVEQCQKNYNMTPKFDWALNNFGGRDPHKDFENVTNLILSNGKLDPWQVGGFVEPFSQNIIVLHIDEAAHQHDLRAPHEKDPASVTHARALEMAHLRKWVQEI